MDKRNCWNAINKNKKLHDSNMQGENLSILFKMLNLNIVNEFRLSLIYLIWAQLLIY